MPQPVAMRLELDELFASGETCFKQGQWANAFPFYAGLVLLAPQDVRGYLGAGQSLRNLGKLDDAERVLQQGLNLFPGHEHLGIAMGWAAVSKRCFSEAIARFQVVRQSKPGSMGAWHGLSVALLESGLFSEAESVLNEIALPEGAFGLSILGLMIRAATGLGRSDLAVARLQALVQRAPDVPSHYTALVNAHRASGNREAMVAVMEAALVRFGDNLDLMIALGQADMEAEDWRTALTRWEAVKTVFPSAVDGYMGCALALRAMDRPEDADLVLGPAMRMFPGHLGLLKLSAEVAGEAMRWPEAERRWQMVQKAEPGAPSAFINEVQVHLSSGASERAEQLAVALLERFPEDVWVTSLFAQVAAARQDWNLALSRWREVARRFPAASHVQVGLAECLADAGQRDEAEALMEAAFERFPGDLSVATAHARLPMRWVQWDRSELRWKALLAQAPHHVPALVGYAALLATVECVPDAVKLLESAQVSPSGRFALDVELARLAVQMRKWPQALDMLARLKGHRPWNRTVRMLVADALWHVRQDQALDADAVPDIPEILLRTDDDEARERQEKRKLLIRFESLGDSCEFGMVQRRFGAEPLSLLRWTSSPPEGLADALACRLEGIGSPRFTELRVAPQGSEYVTWDARFQMFSHTFTPSFSISQDAFYTAHCRRMQFMRNKLLDDFANSEKIFVYASAKLDDANIAELHLAARNLGERVVLLCVRPASEEHPAGQVKRLVDGLLIGAIRQFSTVNIEIEEWLSVCRQALVLAGRDTQ